MAYTMKLIYSPVNPSQLVFPYLTLIKSSNTVGAMVIYVIIIIFHGYLYVILIDYSDTVKYDTIKVIQYNIDDINR